MVDDQKVTDGRSGLKANPSGEKGTTIKWENQNELEENDNMKREKGEKEESTRRGEC